MASLLLGCSPATDAPDTLRIATFNVAMGLEDSGALADALRRTDDPRLLGIAAIVQTVRPDVLLLNEFDYVPDTDAAALLNDHYLDRPADGRPGIRYPHAFRAPVNTGIDSGLDLDRDGRIDGPGDAWGFGRFPGQYAMLVLSRHPIDEPSARSFREFRWSALPGAHAPQAPDGGDWYAPDIWAALRLSSKSHWDVPIVIGDRRLHLLAFHPTPPVFDGPEDRNGLRNFDEIGFWSRYLDPVASAALIDDDGRPGGLDPSAAFVIAGDFNADPFDGDSVPGAAAQLLDHPRIDPGCVPGSAGGARAASQQGGANADQNGDPAADTADFDDATVGNLRLDYVLPSATLRTAGCGVFWPAPGETGSDWVTVSDHRLVWLDVSW